MTAGFLNHQQYSNHLSHEKNPGWLGYIGDYTAQLYGDYNKPLERSLLNNQYKGSHAAILCPFSEGFKCGSPMAAKVQCMAKALWRTMGAMVGFKWCCKWWCFEENSSEGKGDGTYIISKIFIISMYNYSLPVVPHKAVAEVSRIGNYRRDWLLWVTDGRAKTLMDRTVQVSRWLIDELTNWLID